MKENNEPLNHKEPMPMRILGRTGLQVSCIGLGGMGFMCPQGGQEQASQVINAALDRGVNFIDTARSYFESEKYIGRVLETRRDEVYIASKTYMRAAGRAEKEIQESFEALGAKKIDLYQIHHLQYWDEFEQIKAPGGVLEILESYRRQGLIDFIGVSSHNPEILPQVLQSDLFDTVQFPFSPVEREFYHKVRDVVKSRNIGTIIMKPLAGGHLESIEAALRYILSFDVSTVIPGCSTVEHVITDTDAARGFHGISPDEKKMIMEEADQLPDQFCRRCRYCEKQCGAGIQISDILRCENYLILSATYARNQYAQLKKNYTHCLNCGKCEKICPYNLPVREKLKKAHERLSRGKIEDFVVNVTRKLGIYDWARMLYFKIGGKIPKR